MAASLKRVVQLGIHSGFQVKSMKNNVYACATTSIVSKQRPCDYTYRRDLSQLVNPNWKRVCLVDTLALVRSLEVQGVPTKQAEAITSAITKVLYDSLENVAATFVSKADMQKIVMLQEVQLSKFKSEVQSSEVRSLEALGVPTKQAEAITSTITQVLYNSLENVAATIIPKADMQKTVMLQEAQLSMFKFEVQISQEHHFSMLQRETEKLRTDIEKMHSELTNKLDREFHGLKAQLEAAKYDVIKYCMGTLISISAVGFAIIHILM